VITSTKIVTSVATVMTDVFQKNGIMVSKKLDKIMRIFGDMGKIVTEIVTNPWCRNYQSDSFELIYDPSVFDVFHVHKYSHDFS
jgi:hypothetical protein